MSGWHCPSCGTIIRHNEQEAVPSAGRRYRCHVCRLTLDFDPDKQHLAVADDESDHQSAGEADKARRRLALLIHNRRKTPRAATGLK